MKKIYILLSDIFVGMIAGFCFFIIINSISRHIPYRFAEIICEKNSPAEIFFVFIFILIITFIFIIVDSKNVEDFKIKKIILRIVLFIMIFFILQIVSVNILKYIYKEPIKKFENLVNAVVEKPGRQEIKIYNNNYGFEYILVSEGMILKATDIEKHGLSKNIANKLEYVTYNSDLITVKAVKGNMVFKKELNATEIDLETGYFIAKTGEKIKIYKTIKSNRTVISGIE